MVSGNLYGLPNSYLRVIYESFYGFKLFDFGKVPKNVSHKNDILSEHRIIKMRIITLSYVKN